MRGPRSIRARLLLAAAAVMVAFMAGAGIAVQQAHADSVRASHYTRLQGTVYLLLARAELDNEARLVMPPEFTEQRLSLPASGLYAGIFNVARGEQWRSGSTVGLQLPFARSQRQGEWRFEEVEAAGRPFLSATYAVNWAGVRRQAPLVLTVLEDKVEMNREVASFSRTLWSWLTAAGVLLLLAQLLLLRWGLAPLRRVTQELRRIEGGEQQRVEGDYPEEIAGLTGNLNALLQQERERQTRYKEALSFLAHSLKTPLAVLRGAIAQPAQLPAAVDEQVARMDAIVQHQLGRAAAGGATRFTPPIAVAPIAGRIRDALAKVYADKGIAIEVACPPSLTWRIDEGDLFEMLGNLMDNASKWCRAQVRLTVRQEGGDLRILVEDDGPGFTDTEAVLQLHVRMDERVPGHGVGLTVVKDLVASHRGTMKLARSASLQGGVVDIRIPSP